MNIAGRFLSSLLVVQLGGIALSTGGGAAQVPSTDLQDEPGRGGISLGLGTGGLRHAGLVTLRMGSRESMVVARGLGTGRVTLFGSKPLEHDSDIALLYGRRREGPGDWMAVAAGPAMTFSSREGVGSKVVGLALQAEVAVAPIYAFAVGVTAFANVNRTRSFAGLVLGVHIGKQRSNARTSDRSHGPFPQPRN